MRNFIVGAAAVMLASCATSYGDMGYLGGVRADQISATQFRIVSRGNAYTAQTTIADYALRKAAETALEHGAEWFMPLDAQDRSTRGTATVTTPTQTYGTATAYGNTATYQGATYGGATNITEYVKPGQDLMIEIGSGPRPHGALDARETLTYVVARTGG